MSLTLAFCLAAVAAAPGAADPTSEADDPQARPEILVTGERDADDFGAKVTSAATRLSLSQRETPQSVSIITRAQIDAFNLDDVNQVLATTTGINVQQVETDRTYYSARGFDITNFQIDGIGLPFAYGLQNGALDTVTYDRIEVLRGANGLLSSTGNPSATINFVHKRPTRGLNASASALYGSFDQVRVDGDVSVPLTSDGSIRARGVGAYLDADSYLDRYHTKRSVLYGIIEADLTPTTLVSAGYQRQDNRTAGSLWGALPLFYTDGTPTDYARSTSTGIDWSHWNIKDQQIFGDVTQQLGGGWIARVSALRHAIDEKDRLFYVYGTPDRETGDGLFSFPGAFKGPTRDLTLDAYVSGPVTLFGRAHDLVVGVNRGAARVQQYSSYPPGDVPLPGDSAFDGSYPLPDFPDFTLSADMHQRRESAYALVRLNPADGLKLMLGGNVTHAKSEGYSYGVASNFSKTKALPFVGATADLTPHLTAYASFATIFNPQTETDVAHRVLPPIEGDNLEAGIKGAWHDGKLNASVSIFRARQKNTAEAAGFDPGTGQTYYTTIDATSEGIEADLGGEVLPGLQATAGYTLLRIESPEGDPVRTYVPR
ncbi:MAG TPA: TonB-dependent receptor, partial [Sphingomonas sp.]|nr:TonB-dependent receptor [Sphingomonas sp.]